MSVIFTSVVFGSFKALARAQEISNQTAGGENNSYIRRNLIVNRFDPNDPTSPPNATIIDPLLINPWGTAIRPAGAGGHFWLANAGSSTATTYVGDVRDANGVFIPIFQDALKVVPVDGSPIGQVFSNSTTEFPVSGSICSDDGAVGCDPGAPSYIGELTAPSRFIVATEEGQIAAWTEGRVNNQFGRMRRFNTVRDNSGRGALYRGLAVTELNFRNWLLAANFSRDRIEVYDGGFRRIRFWVDDNGFYRPFAKPSGVPSNYVPFNIQTLGGKVYVAYAELILPTDPDFDPAEPFKERTCAGCGYVAEFTQRGRHTRTFERGRRLNAPWGMAIAPANFGRFSNALLVANFGDGTVTGYNRATGRQMGYLRDASGDRIEIDGIWAIFFGNGASLGRAVYL